MTATTQDAMDASNRDSSNGVIWPATALADLTPLADYLGSVLRGLRPLPSLEIDLTQAYGNVLAEDVYAPGPLPAFDQSTVDGYAARART